MINLKTFESHSSDPTDLDLAKDVIRTKFDPKRPSREVVSEIESKIDAAVDGVPDQSVVTIDVEYPYYVGEHEVILLVSERYRIVYKKSSFNYLDGDGDSGYEYKFLYRNLKDVYVDSQVVLLDKEILDLFGKKR